MKTYRLSPSPSHDRVHGLVVTIQPRYLRRRTPLELSADVELVRAIHHSLGDVLHRFGVYSERCDVYISRDGVSISVEYGAGSWRGKVEVSNVNRTLVLKEVCYQSLRLFTSEVEHLG